MKKFNAFLVLMLSSTFANAVPDLALLDHTRWQKEDVYDTQQFTLTFRLAENSEGVLSIGGVGACNTYFGSFNVVDNQVEAGPIASTLMHCGPLHKSESAFFSRINKTVDIQLINHQLVLLGRNDENQLEPILVFNPN